MSEWHHPRKATAENVSYLIQLESLWDRDQSQPAADELPLEDIVDNVLEDLQHTTASLMQDKRGSMVLEKIATSLTPLQLRLVLARCRGYALSLANQRYSSHVLQTLLALAGPVIQDEMQGNTGFILDETLDGGELDKAQQERAALPLLQDIVVALGKEMAGAWSELGRDMCGSHMARALLKVLGGAAVEAAPMFGAPRGKRQREENAWQNCHVFNVPESFTTLLGEITQEFLALPSHKLQRMSINVHFSPLLIVLLKVHAGMDSTEASPRLDIDGLGMSLVKSLLDWSIELRSSDVVFGMSGEAAASHVVETIIRLSPDDFFQELYAQCFASAIIEYCQHHISNYLVQAILERVTQPELATAIIAELGSNAAALAQAGRLGVLWKAAEACLRLDLPADVQKAFIRAVGLGVLKKQGSVGGDEGESPNDDEGETPDDFALAQQWVPALLHLRIPGDPGVDRLTVVVPGARIIQNILQFPAKVCAPVVSAILLYPEETLVAIARDNLAGRCLLDPLLRPEVASKKVFQKAIRGVVRAFKGRELALASDKIAHHILLKCFSASDLDGKKGIVEGLTKETGAESDWNRLLAVPSGRAIAKEFMIERFQRNRDEWEAALRKKGFKGDMLGDILAVGGTAAKASKGAKGKQQQSKGKHGSDELAGEAQPEGKKKRVRSRGRRKKEGQEAEKKGDGASTDGVVAEVGGAGADGALEEGKPKEKKDGQKHSKRKRHELHDDGTSHSGAAAKGGDGASAEGAAAPKSKKSKRQKDAAEAEDGSKPGRKRRKKKREKTGA